MTKKVDSTKKSKRGGNAETQRRRDNLSKIGWKMVRPGEFWPG